MGYLVVLFINAHFGLKLENNLNFEIIRFLKNIYIYIFNDVLALKKEKKNGVGKNEIVVS